MATRPEGAEEEEFCCGTDEDDDEYEDYSRSDAPPSS